MGETLIEGGASGDAVDANVVDTNVIEEPAAAAPEPAAPAWEDPAFIDLVDTRANELVSQHLAPILPLLRQALSDGGHAPVEPGALNPWDESFGGNLDARFEALKQEMAGMFQQIAAPLAEQQQQAAVQHWEGLIADMKADEFARNGDLPETAKAQIDTLALAFLPEYRAKFGDGNPRAVEMAIAKSAGLLRDIVAEARTSAVAQETNRLSTLAGARSEPGVNGAGVTTVTDGKPLTARELALKYGGRASTLRG